MREYPVQGHVSSWLPEDTQWTLAWHDEFDGPTLDTDKWAFRTHLMGVRNETWLENEGISFDNESNILFHLVEKEGEYYSAQLQTGYNFMDAPAEAYSERFQWKIGKIEPHKFLHRYGYYECRCRMQQKPAWWSAFWLQSPIIGATLDPRFSGVEVDIMEQFERNPYIVQNLHWSGYGSQHQHLKNPENPHVALGAGEDGYHTFGCQWTPARYTFYVDGRQTWTADEPVSQADAFILIGTECKGYRAGAHSPYAREEAVPDTFAVDYVRVFDAIDG